MDMTHPHGGQPILSAGDSLDNATAAMILIHGRGADPRSILGLGIELQPSGFALFAPSAYGNTWYPHRFIVPREHNEPYLSSALRVIAELVTSLEKTIPSERFVIVGFSQGACLALEFAARFPRRYGAVLGFSGGLIGDILNPADYTGSLDGTPVFLGCDADDFHVPVGRVHETTQLLTQMGAVVTEKIYPDLGHTINDDELALARALIQGIGNPSGSGMS